MKQFINILLPAITCLATPVLASPTLAQFSPVVPPPLAPPRPLPTPSPLPTPPPPLEIQPSPQPPVEGEDIPGTIRVKRFVFQGNQAISTEDLEAVTAPFLNQDLTIAQLFQARDAVTNFYLERGYLYSRARLLELPENAALQIEGASVTIQILEGKVEAIQVEGSSRIRSYVRSRLNDAISPVFNLNRLEEALRLLQVDPLVERIAVRVDPGSRRSTARLDVQVEASPPFGAQIFLNNNRSPAVGSFERGVQLDGNSLLGLGEHFNLTYRNTAGSNQEDVRFSMPFNTRNGTVQFAFSNVNSRVIEEPFNELDLTSAARSYSLSVRQPLLRRATEAATQELAVGVSAARLESQTRLLDTPFPLAAGADPEGRTRILAMRPFVEYTQRSGQQVLFARSGFNFGLGIGDATINPASPDGRFVSWQGETVWVRSLPHRLSLQARGALQLADRPLPSLEQFVLGGATTVRGYREQGFLGDNGFLGSLELGIPVLSTNGLGRLSVIPFFDVGVVWNSSGIDGGNSQTLASTGVGLQYTLSDRVFARLDAALPLITLSEPDSAWRGNTLSVNINYQFF